MPLYEYSCPKCKCGRAEMRKVDERNDLTPCPRQACHGEMRLVISAVAGFVKNPAVPRGRK